MPSTNFPADLTPVLDSIRTLVESLRASSRKSERDLGLSGAQLFVLQKLGTRDGLSMNELARLTLTHQSSVSTVVSRLEERKLLSRVPSPEDRRRVVIRLTARGRNVLRRAPLPAQDALIQALGSLSAAERNQLKLLLGRVMDRAGFDAERAPLFFERNHR